MTQTKFVESAVLRCRRAFRHKLCEGSWEFGMPFLRLGAGASGLGKISVRRPCASLAMGPSCLLLAFLTAASQACHMISMYASVCPSGHLWSLAFERAMCRMLCTLVMGSSPFSSANFVFFRSASLVGTAWFRCFLAGAPLFNGMFQSRDCNSANRAAFLILPVYAGQSSSVASRMEFWRGLVPGGFDVFVSSGPKLAIPCEVFLGIARLSASLLHHVHRCLCRLSCCLFLLLYCLGDTPRGEVAFCSIASCVSFLLETIKRQLKTPKYLTDRAAIRVHLLYKTTKSTLSEKTKRSEKRCH